MVLRAASGFAIILDANDPVRDNDDDDCAGTATAPDSRREGGCECAVAVDTGMDDDAADDDDGTLMVTGFDRTTTGAVTF